MNWRRIAISDTSHYPKEGPWVLPEGWVWLSGDDIFLPMENMTPQGEFFDYIDIDAIDNETNRIKAPKHIAVKNAPSRATRKVRKGDVLFSMVRPYLRNIAFVTIDDCIASTGFFVCRCSEVLDSKYCYYMLLSNYVVEGLNQFMKGDNSPSINYSHITSWLYPIPPLSEQKRINTSLDNLMISLESLDEATSCIKRSIEVTKSRILDLAIHGKLVPQDPSDEPASSLIMRLNPSFKPSDNLHYGEALPKGWGLSTLGEISNYGRCISVPVTDIDDDAWVLELEDIERDSGHVIRRIAKKERVCNGTRNQFKKGQVLYSKLRTYLNKVSVAEADGFCTTEIIPIEPIEGVDPYYLNLVLRSPYFLDYTASCVYGVKMPRLGTNDARKAIIPLPPHKEQGRIVSTVRNLFSVIDQINGIVENCK